MKDKFEEFIEGYKKTSPEIKSIIDSDQIGLFVEKILVNTNYVGLKPKFGILVTERILGVTEESELSDLLIKLGISSGDIQSLLFEIKHFVDSILNKSNQKTDITTDAEVIKNIAEVEAVFDTLNPIRTMANDNQMIGQQYKEKMHTSTQSAILNESKSSGQWETEK